MTSFVLIDRTSNQNQQNLGKPAQSSNHTLSARGRVELEYTIQATCRSRNKGYKNTQGQANVSFLPLRPGRDCLNTGVASDFCVSLNTASVLALSTDPTMLYSAA